MKLWIKLQHWFYRTLIDYKTKKIVEFNKERENYLKNKTMKFWIARDFDGVLNLYVNKPKLDSNDNMFCIDNMEDDYFNIDKDLYPEVTFENSPQQLELKLVKEE